MNEWINIAIVSFLIYKLGNLTELDLGREGSVLNSPLHQLGLGEKRRP